MVLEQQIDHKTITRQLIELRELSPIELQNKWRDLYDAEPPAISKSLLVKKLSYRIQELEYGVFSDKAKKLLKEHTEAYEQGNILNKKQDNAMPVAGTKLTRIYDGEEHQVTVVRNGYEYKGQIYKSLSVIARRITGIRWSGPKFFGLKR